MLALPCKVSGAETRLLCALCATTIALGGCASGGSGISDSGPRDVTVRVNAQGVRGEIETVSDNRAATHVVVHPQAALWSVLPHALERLGFEVTYSDPATFSLGNEGARVRRLDGRRLSTWLECGRGVTAQPHADAYSVTASILVTLNEVDGGSTEVVTQLDALARPRTQSGASVACTSKHLLELRLAEILDELASAPQ